jgi:hypothetical protein
VKDWSQEQAGKIPGKARDWNQGLKDSILRSSGKLTDWSKNQVERIPEKVKTWNQELQDAIWRTLGEAKRDAGIPDLGSTEEPTENFLIYQEVGEVEDNMESIKDAIEDVTTDWLGLPDGQRSLLSTVLLYAYRKTREITYIAFFFTEYMFASIFDFFRVLVSTLVSLLVRTFDWVRTTILLQGVFLDMKAHFIRTSHHQCGCLSPYLYISLTILSMLTSLRTFGTYQPQNQHI